jgi:hypothetical protein
MFELLAIFFFSQQRREIFLAIVSRNVFDFQTKKKLFFSYSLNKSTVTVGWHRSTGASTEISFLKKSTLAEKSTW